MSNNLLGSGTLRIVYDSYDIQFYNHITTVSYSQIFNYKFRNKFYFLLRADRAGFIASIESEILIVTDLDADSAKDLFNILNINPEITVYPAYSIGSPISYTVKCVSDISNIDIHEKLRVGQKFKLKFKETEAQSSMVYEA